MENLAEVQIGLIVPRELVKRTKDLLQAMDKLDKTSKIKPFSDDGEYIIVNNNRDSIMTGKLHIPTTMRIHTRVVEVSSWIDLVKQTGLQDHSAEIGFVGSTLLGPTKGSALTLSDTEVKDDGNLLSKAFGQWLHHLGRQEHEQSDTVRRERSYTIKGLPCSWTYMIYPPLLLLPPSTFLSCPILNINENLSDHLPSLYNLLCKDFKVTHIALNAPIPTGNVDPWTANMPSVGHEANDESIQQSPQPDRHPVPNLFRSPTGLTPLFGDFGPALPLDQAPTTEALASAFWCTSRQNGIFQTWAPRYTMFSRGNISEKARILNLESLTESALGMRPEQTTAVDLYAGIGYFAFSYAKAGVGKVLCWEINPWSIEGLRRGAGGNKWAVRIMKTDDPLEHGVDESKRLLVYPESNEHAATSVTAIRDKVPPIRHVNCGLLPSSRDSWEVAVQVLDPAGGWIHVHENIAKRDIESRKEEIVRTFVRLASMYGGREPHKEWEVECDNVELVKSYAPGVMHYVLDIFIAPIAPD